MAMTQELLASRTFGLSAGAEPSWRGDHRAGLFGCSAFSTRAIELSVGSEPELAELLTRLDDPTFLQPARPMSAIGG